MVMAFALPVVPAPDWFFNHVPKEFFAFLTPLLATRTQTVYGRELGRLLSLTPAEEDRLSLDPQQGVTLLALY